MMMETSDATLCSTDHKSKRKKRGHSADNKQSQLLKQNPFSSLADFSQDEQNCPTTSQVVNTTVKKKQPPLVVKNVEIAALMEQIPKCGVTPMFKITRFGTKVLCDSIEDHNKVQAYLQKCNFEYFTHDKPGERPYRVVLRGLPLVDTNELLALLKTECELDALAIHIIRRKVESSKQSDALYLVQFPKGYTTLKKLQEVKYIANLVVRWQAYRNNRADVTQCMNCLYHGHGTRNCHLKSRCNNCGAAHTTENCPEKEKPSKKCANCNGAHPATDRSCPKRAEYVNIRKQATNSNQPGRKPIKKVPPAPEFNTREFPPLPNFTESTRSSNPVGFQFAANAGNNQRRLDPRMRIEEAASSTPVNNEQTLYSSAELWTIFNELCGRMRQCKTRADQVQVLGYMVCRYGVN